MVAMTMPVIEHARVDTVKVSFSASMTPAEWADMEPKLRDAGLYVKDSSEVLQVKLSRDEPEFAHVKAHKDQLSFDVAAAEQMPMPSVTITAKALESITETGKAFKEKRRELSKPASKKKSIN
jgi:hypothetical protein